MGGSRRPRVHGPQRRSARTPSSCATACGYADEPADRDRRQARPGARGRSCRWRTSRRPARRRSRRSPSSSASRSEDRQGRLLRDRRRPVRGRHRARRLRRQRDEARQRASRRVGGLRPAHGRGDQGARHGGRLRLADRRPRRGGRRRRAGRALAEPRRRREPRRAGTSATSTCRATTRRTSSPRSRTPARATPARRCGSPVKLRNGHRGRQHLQARDRLHRRVRGDVPRRGRRARTRSSWARTGSASGATWPASSRRTTTRRASSGRPRSRPTRPTSCRSAPTKEPQVVEVAERLHDAGRPPAGARDPVRRPRRVARASSSPTPSCSACPGS